MKDLPRRVFSLNDMMGGDTVRSRARATGRRRRALAPLAALAAAGLFLAGCGDDGGSGPPGPPGVAVRSPADGSDTGADLLVRFEVSNWEVVPGGDHVHWFLDGTDQGPRYDLEPVPVTGLAAGPHAIAVELYRADHSPTGMRDEVAVTVDPGIALAVTWPPDGGSVGTSFNISFTVTGWDVKPGGRHLHWFLDGEDRGPHYELSDILVSGVDPGTHTISLRLAEADHTFTGVEDSVVTACGV
jgi:hypothetical protein